MAESGSTATDSGATGSAAAGSAATASAAAGFAATSRAFVAYAAELIAGVERRVVGDGNVRTARGNAHEAMRADQARAQARADVDAMVAALAAAPRPRNSRPVPARRSTNAR